MSDRTRAQRITIIVLCACLVLAGAWAVVWGLHRSPRTASIPPPSATSSTLPAPSTSSTQSPTGPSTAAPRKPTATAQPVSSAPTAVQIPSIDEGSALLRLGTADDQSIEVPDDAHADQAGWYTGSPMPGQDGPAVIVGHSTSSRGAAVFFRLAKVKVGARIEVSTAVGNRLVFTVYRVGQYAKTNFPSAEVYGNTAGPELRLVTCGGTFDAQTGHFEDNTVLYARLAA